MDNTDQTLRMYAIMRADLQMSPGKLASQAGHAFVDTFERCRKTDPDRATEYISDGHGTKVVLEAESEEHLRTTYELVKRATILPCTLIIDSGHVLLPYFDGSPIVTALGIGPARRDEIQAITHIFPLVK